MAMIHEPPAAEPGKSLPALLKELTSSLARLLQKESELARAEVLQGMRETQHAGRWLAIALVPAAVGLVLIALAIAHGLAAYMPLWLASLIPGAALLVAAAALAVIGARRTARAGRKLKPEQTAQSLHQDREFLSEQFSQLKRSVTGET